MIKKSICLATILFVVFLFGCAHADGGLVTVFLDSSTDNITIEGVVDTAADEFTITSWTSTGTFFARLDLPVTLQAVDGTGALFDVPDTFETTGIGSNWFFLETAFANNGQMNWSSPHSGGLFTRYGWGGAQVNNTNYFTGFDETRFGALPSSFSGGGAPTFDMVTFTTASIPEPSSGLMFAMVVGPLLFQRRRT